MVLYISSLFRAFFKFTSGLSQSNLLARNIFPHFNSLSVNCSLVLAILVALLLLKADETELIGVHVPVAMLCQSFLLLVHRLQLAKDRVRFDLV